MYRKWLIRFVVTITMMGLLMLSATLITYRDLSYICENTGSRKGSREWSLGITTNEWYKESELEMYMEDRHPGILSHNWTCYSGIGGPFLKSYGHGKSGPISIASIELLNTYILTLPEDDKLDLYFTFCSADEDRVTEVIEAVYGLYR